MPNPQPALPQKLKAAIDWLKKPVPKKRTINLLLEIVDELQAAHLAPASPAVPLQLPNGNILTYTEQRVEERTHDGFLVAVFPIQTIEEAATSCQLVEVSLPTSEPLPIDGAQIWHRIWKEWKHPDETVEQAAARIIEAALSAHPIPQAAPTADLTEIAQEIVDLFITNHALAAPYVEKVKSLLQRALDAATKGGK